MDISYFIKYAIQTNYLYLILTARLAAVTVCQFVNTLNFLQEKSTIFLTLLFYIVSMESLLFICD